MKFAVLEQVKSADPLYAREREKLLIRKFDSGINKEPKGFVYKISLFTFS